MEQETNTKILLIKKWLGSGSINIFGLPFSGKDTHGNELAKFFGAEIISGGDILRSGGPEHIKQHISKGHLAPTDEYLAIVLPYLSRAEFDKKPLVLSSVGRWRGEEKSVTKAAKESSHPIRAVLYLDISKKEAERRRLSAGRDREDDTTHEILLNRFSEFETKTAPVIDFYRKAGLLLDIDGMPPKQTVTNDIIDKLAELAAKSNSK